MLNTKASRKNAFCSGIYCFNLCQMCTNYFILFYFHSTLIAIFWNQQIKFFLRILYFNRTSLECCFYVFDVDRIERTQIDVRRPRERENLLALCLTFHLKQTFACEAQKRDYQWTWYWFRLIFLDFTPQKLNNWRDITFEKKNRNLLNSFEKKFDEPFLDRRYLWQHTKVQQQNGCRTG